MNVRNWNILRNIFVMGVEGLRMQWGLPTLKNTMFGEVEQLEICLGSLSRLWPCIIEEGKVLCI